MRRVALTFVATVVGLVLLLQFKTHPGGASGTFATLGTPPAHHRSHHSAARPTAAPTVTQTSPPKPRKPRTVTSTGQAVQTPYGPVQVKIVETGGQLTDIVALQLPNGDSRSAEIAAGAVPILHDEALRAGGAHIHVVSGATYTSDGYAQSLQSAIDNA